MLKYYAFLYAGDVLLDILKDRKGIVFSDEQKRRFRIGLLCSDEANPWLPRKIKSFFSISEPFYLGLAFGKFLKKKISGCNWGYKQRGINDDDKKFADEHKLVMPNVNPYFKVCIGVSMSNYLSEYCVYEKGRELQYIDKDKDVIETKLIEFVESFYRWNFWHIGKLRCQKKFDSGTQHVRWRADEVKRTYYKTRWKEICDTVYGKDNHKEIDGFFDGLLTELDDISASSNKMRKGWDKDEKNVIYASFLITFVTLLSAASNLKSDDEDTIYGLLALGFSGLSAFLAALNSAVTMLRSHHAYRETWLRHQLNYSRLTHEIEQFCECIGDYKFESDGKPENDKKKYSDNIKKFQERISELRNTDYDNFFSNMDCINYKSGK